MIRPLPKIGMRIVKSAVAVFLCFVIYMIRGRGVPFYSAIAAVLCMQPYVSNSVRVALNRTVGTFIGGVFGMLALLVEKAFFPTGSAHLAISAGICLSIIPLIYVTLLAKRPTASYITCVVFMSITVSHGADVNPYLFALDRCLDTLIGIAVSLCVNLFRLPPAEKSPPALCSVPGLPGRRGRTHQLLHPDQAQSAHRPGGPVSRVAAPQPPAYFSPATGGNRSEAARGSRWRVRPSSVPGKRGSTSCRELRRRGQQDGYKPARTGKRCAFSLCRDPSRASRILRRADQPRRRQKSCTMLPGEALINIMSAARSLSGTGRC